MGGSSNSSGYSTGMSSAQKQALAQQSQALGQAQGYYGTMTGYGQQIGNLANSSAVQNLAGAGLTTNEQEQMKLIGIGRANAEQTIQQNVRESASSRGLFSSAGAIGQEAAGLANLDVQEAQAKSDIYGNAQNRQFQGLGLQSGLLGQAGSIYGNAGGGLTSIAGGYGNIAGTYQNQQNLNNQSQLMQNQWGQYQQQQQYGQIKNTVGLLAAPFTGGMSLGLLG